MTTTRKPMSGRGQNDIKNLHGYNVASKKAATGTFMRTFSRTKTSNLVTAWNDVHQFIVKNQYFTFLADSTGNVDSATVGDPGGLVLLDVLWETFYENANLKDLVVNDEAAWKLYFLSALQICLDFQIMHNFRCYLPAYTESDTASGGSASISYFAQSSYDILVASMKDFPIPKGVYELVDTFCTWVVKLTSEYERYTLRIPAAILQPFTCCYDLADFEAMRAIMRVNLGGFTTHAKKYGLKTVSWRDPVQPSEKLLSDPDVIAYFNHSPFRFYDNQPSDELITRNGGYDGANLTTDYTATEFFFKDTPNESKIHALAPWFGIYSGTNNPYGGFIHQRLCNTAEYYVNICFCAQHGTAMQAANFGDAIITDLVLTCHKALWDNKAAAVSFNINGTNFTAAKGVDDVWPLSTFNLLFTGSGRGATETNNDLLNLLGRSLK